MTEGANPAMVSYDDQDDAPDFLDNPAARLAMSQAVRMAEAIIFASAEPVAERHLAARLPEGVDLGKVMEELRALYANRGVNLVKVGDAWAFRTAGDLAFLMSRDQVQQKKLSRAALEVLAIIAYHQPVTRAEIEEIRGVSTSKGTLDVLLETGWIKLRGRRRAPGRPVTYGTTEQFLATTAENGRTVDEIVKEASGKTGEAVRLARVVRFDAAKGAVGRYVHFNGKIGVLVEVEAATGFIAVTSRASFEMVQKTAMAGVPLLAAVSAPTSFAVATAERARLTLVGFARKDDLVVYCRPERLQN